LELNESIIKRIERIEEALRHLEEIKRYSISEFTKDWKLHDSALHNFQIAIEGCLDIGNYIISSIGKYSPTTYIEIVEILVKENILPLDFSDIAKNMVKFRNLIVHEYLYINLERVYSFLEKINDVKKFLKYLTEYFKD